jgi:phosphate transport system substrate-binding protein
VTFIRLSRVAPVATVSALTLTLAACGAGGSASPSADALATGSLTGQLAGAGSSAQESAMQAWIAGFQSANPDVSVAYDPIGSGGGRTQFLEGGSQFAGTDASLDEEELAQAAERCPSGEAAELPLYVSPIAVIFNLEGITELNLTPEAVAGLFTGEITQWDDPVIAADNPGVDLPSVAVTPVSRSDESGTTENFTEYLHAAAGEAWPYEPSGSWPVTGGQSAQGTSGVVQTVMDGQGTIGYADASKAGSLGTVNVQVGDGFVGHSAEAAAAVVDASPRAEGRPAASLVVELERDTTAAGAYPIVLVSYSLACTQYADPADAALVKAFLTYVASPEGQQAAAGAAGSAPISDALRQEVMAVVDQIS